jgi:N-methylhydantoinase A
MAFICGVDIGGTFTDTVVVDEKGRFVRGKASSTPSDFSQGFFNSLQSAAEALGLSRADLLSDTSHLFHGTTVATNAVVQLRGARVGLLTTRGHRDTLSIMRTFGRVAGLDVEQLVHFASTAKPAPLVPKSLIEEVDERIDCKGQVVVALNEAQARDAVAALLAKDVEAIAICLLWSFLNDEHERRLMELVREAAPGLYVCSSSELVPKWGEYERTAATAINAFVGPVVDGYLTEIETRLASEGYDRQLLVMQCAGGLAPARQAREAPLLTLQSGPVGGATGSAFLGQTIGEPNVIVTDMGGTSFDVGVISAGDPIVRATSIVNQYQYFVPMVDIESIGAGGGSIAWVDPTSRTLKVGPDSAGADPGPASYGRGGTRPTVTDADVVLGYIDPEYFLGGRMNLDADAARAALATVAEPLGMSLNEAAAGIARIVDSHMADLIRKMTINRGYDPREFVVFAYGGAGPVHASGYARELGAKSVIVPLASNAAVWSAFGVASADILNVYEHVELMVAPPDPAHVQRIYDGLEERARRQLAEEGVRDDDVRLARSADLKYRAQLHEVEAPVEGGRLDPAALERAVEAFERKYEQLYGEGAGFSAAGIEFVTFRVRATGATPKPAIERPSTNGAGEPKLFGERPVWWYELGEARTTPAYDGTTLVRGRAVEGPAIVELPETTVVVRPGQSCSIDDFGNLLIAL